MASIGTSCGSAGIAVPERGGAGAARRKEAVEMAAAVAEARAGLVEEEAGEEEEVDRGGVGPAPCDGLRDAPRARRDGVAVAERGQAVGAGLLAPGGVAAGADLNGP